MTSTKNQDLNQTAARVVAESTGKHEKPIPADLEAAWAEWSRGVQKVDARAMALLRAAFEAGAEAGKKNGYKVKAGIPDCERVQTPKTPR